MATGERFTFVGLRLLTNTQVVFGTAKLSDFPWPRATGVIFQQEVDQYARTDNDCKYK